MKLPRVAVVSDLREERWYAMDLVAETLLLDLATPEHRIVKAIEVRPHMTRRLTRLPLVGSSATADTADRILNRIWDYPRWLRSRAGDFDLFHIADHSYAHLATRLPAGRSLVTCHDLDALRGVLPGRHDGSLVEWALGRQLLKGMRAARKILCVSAATRNELLATEVVHAERVTVVPNAVHPAFSVRSERDADEEAASLLGPLCSTRYELLHVGSTIPRKRLDVLLNIVSVLRVKDPCVRLIQVGGALTAGQRTLASSLGLDGHITVLPFVNRRVLAAIYRRAALLMQTSDREGFGLPVAEAMTCGTPVVASDLPALREVGGPATTFCPVGDVERWAATTAALLEERAGNSGNWRRRQADAVSWAQRFNWEAHARTVLDIYREVISSAP